MLDRTCRLGAAGGALIVAAVVGWPTAPSAAPESLSHEAAPAPKANKLPRFGLMTDVGLPDGAHASVVIRPWRSLRFHGGIGYNGISNGVRGGLTFIPFNTWVTPTLSVDYGRYFEGDANPLVRSITSDPSFSSSLLDKVGYDYANAHVGLAFGKKWATFYIQGGVTRVVGNIRNLNDATSTEGMSSTVTFSDDPQLTLVSVSARLGFVFYFVK